MDSNTTTMILVAVVFLVLGGLIVAKLGLVLVAVATMIASPWVAAIGLGLVGIGMAVSEVSVNILGAHVEQQMSKAVLTLIHGCFSLGTAIGALCGLLIVTYGISVKDHMLIACLLLFPLFLYVARGVDPTVVRYLRQTNEGVAAYEELKRARSGLQLAHGLLYFMISLTALLAAIWVGLWFAGLFVAPIRRLIGAAQEVPCIPPDGNTASCGPETAFFCADLFGDPSNDCWLNSDELLLQSLRNQKTWHDDVTYSVGGALRYRYIDERNRLRPPLAAGRSTYDQYRFTPFVELGYKDRVKGYVQAIDAPTCP